MSKGREGINLRRRALRHCLSAFTGIVSFAFYYLEFAGVSAVAASELRRYVKSGGEAALLPPVMEGCCLSLVKCSALSNNKLRSFSFPFLIFVSFELRYLNTRAGE